MPHRTNTRWPGLGLESGLAQKEAEVTDYHDFRALLALVLAVALVVILAVELLARAIMIIIGVHSVLR